MFLSTENPTRDPLYSSSSSSNLVRLTTTSSHELGQSHLSNFSIRDYAYSNRKNNIKNSWPFSTKSLHLFSTHGVTDPLPPFQKQFETTASSSPGKQIVSHVHHQTIAETSGGVYSQSRITKNGVLSKSKVEMVVATTSNNKGNKKCGRGMVKSKEDSCVGLVTTASESKTCPICKTFSSASNTTLNAHIDQCLSVDSAVQPVSSKPNKPRVTSVDSAVPPVSSKPRKPRVNQCMSVDSVAPLVSSKPSKPRVKPQMKVKTLVDIYASAKRCTLEDLDKRNGTKWASVLSCTNRVAADKSEVSKKRKASPVGVGPVYIDAKGQKLRILTEFSEKKTSTTTTTTAALREQQEDGSSEKKSLSQSSKENKKRSRRKKHGKIIKLTNHKVNASEIKVLENQREGSSSKGPRRIYNQRMLAKPGLVSKKLNEKGHKFNDQPSEDDDDDDEWSGEDRSADLSATGSTPLNKQKLRSQVSGRSKTMFESKRAQSRSVRVRMSEKEEKSLAGGAHLDRVQLKKSFGSFQEDKYPPGMNVREVSYASPRATSMRNLSPPFVANGWRRLSPLVGLKRARFDLSEEEEENGKWESEMTQERELSDDDYVSGDNGAIIRRSSPSFSVYDDYEDDDDEETSEEEEDDTKRANVLDLTDDTGNEITPSERAMYYSEDMVYGQTACDEEDVRFGSEVRGKGSLFVEVDTIPIPGPPGSFLPSPRGMGFDENLGNSSVVTSQFQSSMDRNSSESPVSNFASGRLNFPAELPSSYSTTPMSFCVPFHHVTIPEAELMTVDKTTAAGFRNNGHEPCCCQMKDRISLNHESSHLLQRRATTSSSIAMNFTKSPTRLDPNHAFEQAPYVIQQEEFDLHSKFSRSAVVPPPSPSNSVLRLMGKDLMVMNQVEAADNNEVASRACLKPTPQFHDPQPCAGNGLYFNTGLYLRNSFDQAHQQPQTPVSQQQTQAQASPFRNNFDHFPPS